jgi:hypothetical protein
MTESAAAFVPPRGGLPALRKAAAGCTAWDLYKLGTQTVLAEINACRPWLEAELEVVTPKALVCLGATAAQALLGKKFKVTQQRGEWVESYLAPLVTATGAPVFHPADSRSERSRDCDERVRGRSRSRCRRASLSE